MVKPTTDTLILDIKMNLFRIFYKYVIVPFGSSRLYKMTPLNRTSNKCSLKEGIGKKIVVTDIVFVL